ncbi:MAG TPA: signal peptidase I, partial [Blastocatellia bacterium]|nr:signal peptidase I [Blastocatellia bacterium]
MQYRVKALGIAIPLFLGILVFLMGAFVAQPVHVEGNSMYPAIEDGDLVLISKVINDLGRGDIVTFYEPRSRADREVKRIIGLPGEEIWMTERGELYIDGGLIDEPYVLALRNQRPRGISRQVIKEGCYFLMGDNRDVSSDSRSFGPVPRRLIYGKVVG